MEGSSRRGFLRALVREGAKGAQEASRLLKATGPVLPTREDLALDAAPGEAAEPTWARAVPAERFVTVEELLAMAEEVGLEEHLDDVRRLARPSVRLTSPTLDADPAGAWLHEPSGGLVPEAQRPVWEGERLTLVAQLDLDDPALRDVDLPLPGRGRLLFLWAALQAPSGQLAAHRGAARVLHVPSPPAAAPEARLSVELVLPRVWSAPVQRLGLDPIEHDGWLRLRRRLMTLQGVELDDGFGAPVAFHRVLGWPNETSGLMPLQCEVVGRGHDATDVGRPGDEADPLADRWCLLLQLSVEASGAWNLGGEGGRLYLWIPEEDLAAGDFSRVHAIAQP